MSAQPLPKGLELYNEIAKLYSSSSVNEFSVARYKREAEKLVKHDPFHAYYCLGILHCYSNEPDKMDEYYSKAIALEPANWEVRESYAISLAKTGKHKLALEGISSYSELNRLASLGLLVDINVASGRYYTSDTLLKDWKALNPGHDHKNEAFINKCVSLLKPLEISEESVIKVLEVSQDMLHDNGIYFHETANSVDHDEYDTWISIEHEVDKDLDLVMKMNFDLADKLAALDIDPKIFAKVVVRFTCVGS